MSPFGERVANSACHLFFLGCLFEFVSLFLILRTWFGSCCICSWVHLFTLHGHYRSKTWLRIMQKKKKKKKKKKKLQIFCLSAKTHRSIYSSLVYSTFPSTFFSRLQDCWSDYDDEPSGNLDQPWVLSYLLGAQQRFWLDWADDQADLNSRLAHMSFCKARMSRTRHRVIRYRADIIKLISCFGSIWLIHYMLKQNSFRAGRGVRML